MESVAPGRGSDLTVDLEACTVTAPDGRVIGFEFDESTRFRLLRGLDDIDLTIEHTDEIAAYEVAHPSPLDTRARGSRRAACPSPRRRCGPAARQTPSSSAPSGCRSSMACRSGPSRG